MAGATDATHPEFARMTDWLRAMQMQSNKMQAMKQGQANGMGQQPNGAGKSSMDAGNHL